MFFEQLQRYSDFANIRKGCAMQTSLDRQRLLKMYHDDPALRARLVIFRCAAGLAIIGLIAVIGLSDQSSPPDASNVAAMKMRANAAAEHRREVLEERQKRFQATDEQRAATYEGVAESNANPSRAPAKHP